MQKSSAQPTKLSKRLAKLLKTNSYTFPLFIFFVFLLPITLLRSNLSNRLEKSLVSSNNPRPQVLQAQTGDQVVDFLYDSSGQRIAKLEEGGTNTYYLSPSLEITILADSESVSDLSWKRNYSALRRQVAIREVSSSDNNLYFTHQDHLASNNLVTDDTGNLVSHQTYYPYGTTRYASGTSPTERQYTGQVSDMDATGLYYYNARYYNPLIAKFTQADTAGDGLNRYAYVSNNPINFTDPTGNVRGRDRKRDRTRKLRDRYKNRIYSDSIAEYLKTKTYAPMSRHDIQQLINKDSYDSNHTTLTATSKDNEYLNFLKKYPWKNGLNLNDVRLRFDEVAEGWLGETGNPRYEMFDYVVSETKDAGIDPIFALTIWLHESGGSNYEGVCTQMGYCDRIQDFGYNYEEYETVVSSSGAIIENDNFKKQLESFLYLPGVYEARLQDYGKEVNMENFFACYHYLSCEPDQVTRDYMNEIVHFYNQLAPDVNFPFYPKVTLEEQ